MPATTPELGDFRRVAFGLGHPPMPDWPTKLRTIQLEPAAAPAPSAAANDDERPAYESPFFVKKLEDLRHELIDEEQEAVSSTCKPCHNIPRRRTHFWTKLVVFDPVSSSGSKLL